MFRLKLIIIFIGGMVAFLGFEEYKVSMDSTEEPMAIELSILEENTKIDNNHLKVENYMALYPYSVYEYQAKKGETGEPGNNTKVTHTYYPIISQSHPYINQIAELSNRYEDLSLVPDEEWPTVQKFSVLVKTKTFKTIGSIPDKYEIKTDIQGLIVNRIEELDSKEKQLVRESFPTVNMSKLLILEEGRKPSSMFKSFGMMGGGAVLSILGIGMFFMGRSD